jgi:hypothetical protein
MVVMFVSATEGWDEIPHHVMGDGIMLPASLITTKEKNPHENRSFPDSAYNQWDSVCFAFPVIFF